MGGSYSVEFGTISDSQEQGKKEKKQTTCKPAIISLVFQRLQTFNLKAKMTRISYMCIPQTRNQGGLVGVEEPPLNGRSTILLKSSIFC